MDRDYPSAPRSLIIRHYIQSLADLLFWHTLKNRFFLCVSNVSEASEVFNRWKSSELIMVQ